MATQTPVAYYGYLPISDTNFSEYLHITANSTTSGLSMHAYIIARFPRVRSFEQPY